MWLVNLTPFGSPTGEIDWTTVYHNLGKQGIKCMQNLARAYALQTLPKCKVVVLAIVCDEDVLF